MWMVCSQMSIAAAHSVVGTAGLSGNQWMYLLSPECQSSASGVCSLSAVSGKSHQEHKVSVPFHVSGTQRLNTPSHTCEIRWTSHTCRTYKHTFISTCSSISLVLMVVYSFSNLKTQMARTFLYDTKLSIRQIRRYLSRNRWQMVPGVNELTVFPKQD